MKLRLLLVLCAISVSGCAQPLMKLAEPTEEQKTLANKMLQASDVSPGRHVSYSEMTPTVNRVVLHVRNAAYRVCTHHLDLRRAEEETGKGNHCDLMLDNVITVYTHESGINAYADQRNEVIILGGLVSAMRNDEEIAAVLAHEMAHVMLDHVEKKTKNALIGMALAGGLAAYGNSYYGTNSQQSRQVTQQWMNVGAMAGSRAYSPEMEIEADRVAIYILQEAGFSTLAMINALQSLNNAKVRKKREGIFKGRVGFLQTHPSNERRIAHLIMAIEDTVSGVPLFYSVRPKSRHHTPPILAE